MTRRCIALLSGGLDSMLAIRLMQEQGIEVEAVNFKTLFTCCQDQAGQAARMLGVKLTVLTQDDDYLQLVRKPQFGYGKGANPCIDCRIYMFERALRYLHHTSADFLVSGELVGQRPKSQKKRDLAVISHHSQAEDLLLRPLSAKILPVTLPEREGWVDREQLFGFYGRGRKELIRLAQKFGFPEIPAPSTGCALTEVLFSQKVHDLIRRQPENSRWDFEMLKYGRHFRHRHAKVIVGRRESENAQIEYLHAREDANSSALLFPHDFQGPVVMVVGDLDEELLEFAAGLLRRFARDAVDGSRVRVERRVAQDAERRVAQDAERRVAQDAERRVAQDAERRVAAGAAQGNVHGGNGVAAERHRELELLVAGEHPGAQAARTLAER